MTRNEIIHAALASVATPVDRLGDGRWIFELRNGPRAPVRARASGAWLSLDARLDAEAARTGVDEWTLLEWNAALAGGARLALSPDAALRLCADVALDSEVAVRQRIGAACAGLRAATGYLRGVAEPADDRRAGNEDAPHGPLEDAPGGPVVDAATRGAIDATDDVRHLLALCRETGWQVGERDPRHVAVDLEVRGAFHEAAVERRRDGTIAACVPVLETSPNESPPSATCRRALAVLLGRVSAIACAVRAAVPAGGSPCPRFEVVYAAPTVAEMAHAFAALSTACGFSAAAMVLRHDETAARTYLRHWDAAAMRRAA